MCRALLAKCVPTGEYFSDWIADELLIFFVADDADRTPELTRTAMTFARELIEAKTAFAEEHGIPYGIDVGLAAGEATVGLFGPRSNRKVMAVGQVAVDARRLQAIGKQLRHLRGESDRIVYTDALYTLAGAPAVATPLDERHPLHVDAHPVGVLFEEPGCPPALLKVSA
jgi:class 3 adenylate cyclase